MIEAASHANEHDGVTRVTRNRPASKPVETSSSQKTILDRIVEARRGSIAHRKRSLPEAALKFAVEKAQPPRDFPAMLSRDAFNVIAELKKASPSRGVLRENYAPGTLAAGLESAGAAALSVLTEEEFFLGSLGDLKEAKEGDANSHPEERFHHRSMAGVGGAGRGRRCVLLIVAILDDATLCELLELGRSLKMEPLVEVHSREEIARAAAAGVRIIGVNNRDLRDFSVRIETSLELIEVIPENCIAVSESGLRTHEDLVWLRRAGFDAFLVGEHLMKDADPATPLRTLLESGGTDGRASG